MRQLGEPDRLGFVPGGLGEPAELGEAQDQPVAIVDRWRDDAISFLLSGVHLAVFIPLDGLALRMIQTDPNTVLQGTATMVSR